MENQEQMFVSSIKPTKLSSFDELFKRSWQIYKERFSVFMGILIIPFLFVITTTAAGLILPSFKSSFLFALLAFFLLILGVIVNLWAIISILYAIKDREEKVGVRECFKRAKSKILSYLWVGFLVGFINLGGAFLLIIPGIIFYIWFVLSPYVLIAEEKKGFSALWKSKQLVKGNWWPVFWRFLLIGLIFSIVGLFFAIFSKDNLFFSLIRIIFSFLAFPFTATFSFLIYEELKRQKEGIPFEEPKTKTKLLFVLIGILGIFFVPAIFSFIVLTSLKGAQDRITDVRIMSSMSQIQRAAVMIYYEEGESYSGVNCFHPEIVSACQEIKEKVGMEPVIHSSPDAYCAYVKMKGSRYWCVDSQNELLLNIKTDPGQKGYCDGITFVCPSS